MTVATETILDCTTSKVLGMTLDWRPEPKTFELHEALAYWRSKAQKGLPSRADLDPRDMLPYLRLVQIFEIDPDGQHFKVRLMGTAVARMFRRDMTGMVAPRPAADDTGEASLLNRRMFAVFDEVQTRRAPVLASATRTAIEPLHGQEIATLFLPLAKDGQTVDMILAVTQVPASLQAH